MSYVFRRRESVARTTVFQTFTLSSPLPTPSARFNLRALCSRGDGRPRNFRPMQFAELRKIVRVVFRTGEIAGDRPVRRVRSRRAADARANCREVQKTREKREGKKGRVINDPTGSDGARGGGGVRGDVLAAGLVPHTGVAPRRVGDVYVGAPVHVTGASLAAGAPCAVEEAGELLAPGGGADDRLRREVRRQGADGRVDVERHQEKERRAAGGRDEGQR